MIDRALIDGGGANIPAIKFGLIDFLKKELNPNVGPLSVRDFIMMQLIGSIYAEGLHLRADTWTVYPGSSRGGPNGEMAFVIDFIVRQFRRPYVGALLVRHTKAVDSAKRGRAAARSISTTRSIPSMSSGAPQAKFTAKRS